MTSRNLLQKLCSRLYVFLFTKIAYIPIFPLPLKSSSSELCCLPGYSPHFAPNKTWLTTLILCLFFSVDTFLGSIFCILKKYSFNFFVIIFQNLSRWTIYNLFCSENSIYNQLFFKNMISRLNCPQLFFFFSKVTGHFCICILYTDFWFLSRLPLFLWILLMCLFKTYRISPVILE